MQGVMRKRCLYVVVVRIEELGRKMLYMGDACDAA